MSCPQTVYAETVLIVALLAVGRTMADEVLRGQNYGLNADVYSIGSVVKQMMAGNKAGAQTLPKFMKERQSNPEINTINPAWPNDVKSFLKICLSAQKSRPRQATELLSHPLISDKKRLAMYESPEDEQPAGLNALTLGRARSKTITSSMWSEMQPRNKVCAHSIDQLELCSVLGAC